MSKKKKQTQQQPSMDSDEPIFEDVEKYKTSGNDKIDFKWILMRQFDKIRISRSVELRGGYEEERLIAINGAEHWIKAWVPSTREIYVNSVTALELLLTTYIDDKYSKLYKNIIETVKMKESDDKQGYYTEMVPAMDKVFKQLLFLCTREGLIGSTPTIRDVA